MDWMAQQELESEWNARYDYVREAYGATALDNEYEAECDRLDAEAEMAEWEAAFGPYVAHPVDWMPW